MNKVIGILTYHSVCNFGANLQALSTVSYFLNHGYKTIIINWLTEELEHVYKSSVPQEQYNAHAKFVSENLPVSQLCRTEEDIVNVINREHIDAVVIGSDAVLQHHPFLSRIVFPSRQILSIIRYGVDRMCPNPFWGSFGPLLERQIPLCLMSASSQNSPYKLMSANERKIASKLLSQFSFISTRDDWTSDMVKFITHGQIVPRVTPDPVFAFNNNVKNQVSEDEIRKKYNIDKPYLLFSFHNSNVVSVDWLAEIQRLAESEGRVCIAMPFPKGIKFNHPFGKEIPLPLSPLEWYALIKHSSGYVGQNMHPIVVSLHNGVPCYCFDHYGVKKLRSFVNKESSKIYHIMNRFNVLDNWVSCVSPSFHAPSPHKVYELLKCFNIAMTKHNADKYLNEYLQMMSEIEIKCGK